MTYKREDVARDAATKIANDIDEHILKAGMGLGYRATKAATIDRHTEIIEAAFALLSPAAEAGPTAEDCAKINAAQLKDEKLTPVSEPGWPDEAARIAIKDEAREEDK